MATKWFTPMHAYMNYTRAEYHFTVLSTHFTTTFSIIIQIGREISFAVIWFTGHQIATKFCAKFGRDHYIKIWTTANWYFHWNLNYDRKISSEIGPLATPEGYIATEHGVCGRINGPISAQYWTIMVIGGQLTFHPKCITIFVTLKFYESPKVLTCSERLFWNMTLLWRIILLYELQILTKLWSQNFRIRFRNSWDYVTYDYIPRILHTVRNLWCYNTGQFPPLTSTKVF